jgi:hypothetical protein
MDNSTQTSYLTNVQRNIQLHKSKTQKILNSMNKKPSRLIDNKVMKNLSQQDNIQKPQTNIQKPEPLYKSKKIKISIHTVLFPYKKLEDEILYKTPVNLQISQRMKNRYDIQSLFKKSDELKTKGDNINTFPLITPKHKRNHTVSNFAEVNTKKNPVNVKSLLGNYMVNVTPKVIEKRTLLRKATTVSQEFNLLQKLQNEKLKELIFK